MNLKNKLSINLLAKISTITKDCATLTTVHLSMKTIVR